MKAAALALRYIAAVAAAAVFLFPLYWMVATALKTREEILTYPPRWWPGSLHLENLTGLFAGGDLAAVANSLLVAAASTILAVLFGTAAAYATARTGMRGRLFAAWAMGTRMAPPVMLALPFYAIVGGSGWARDVVLLVLLLAAFNLPYVLWMMRRYFREIPVGLEEAALVAGLRREQLPLRLALPLVGGGLTATAAFTFVLAWNELAFVLVLTGEGAATLPALLAQVEHRPELWGRAAALGVAGTLPVLIALALMQRHLARTLSLGFVRD